MDLFSAILAVIVLVLFLDQRADHKANMAAHAKTHWLLESILTEVRKRP